MDVVAALRPRVQRLRQRKTDRRRRLEAAVKPEDAAWVEAGAEPKPDLPSRLNMLQRRHPRRGKVPTARPLIASRPVCPAS